jgi:hypothetical protein
MNVCYTALFGNYEELKEPTVITPGWEYICYTDQPLKSKVWQIKHVAVPNGQEQKMARYYKIMEWVDWERSIWVDASFRIDVNLDEWWEKYFNLGFAAPKHPLRNDVYDEMLACIIGHRGNKTELQQQWKHYEELKVPKNNGIITSGLLMRENKPDVIKLCEQWWKELDKWSIRDQVSFAKVSLEFKHIVHTYDWDYRREKDFIYHHHYNRR